MVMDKNTQAFKVHKRRKVLLAFAVLGWSIAAVTVASAIVGVMSGRLGVVIKDADQTVVLHNSVCDNSVVSKYNAILASSPASQVFKNDSKSLADSILSQPNYKQDPNCLYILYWYYSQSNDVKNVHLYVKLLKGQVNIGNNVSNNLESVDSMATIDACVKSLDNGGQSSTGDAG